MESVHVTAYLLLHICGKTENKKNSSSSSLTESRPRQSANPSLSALGLERIAHYFRPQNVVDTMCPKFRPMSFVYDREQMTIK